MLRWSQVVFSLASALLASSIARAASDDQCLVPEPIKQLGLAVGKPMVVAGLDSCEAETGNIPEEKQAVIDAVTQDMLVSMGAAFEVDPTTGLLLGDCKHFDFHGNLIGQANYFLTCEECAGHCYLDSGTSVGGLMQSGSQYDCPPLCETLYGDDQQICTPEDGQTGARGCPPCTAFCACFLFGWDLQKPVEPWSGPCAVTGDPHLIGFDGTDFDFMGYKGGIFSLYSDPSHQINMLLDDFDVPDATYMKSIGFRYGPDVKVEFHSNVSGGFEVSINGMAIPPTSNAIHSLDKDGLVKVRQMYVNSENKRVIVSTPTIRFKVWKTGTDTKHLDAQVAFIHKPAKEDAHGVLGQTLRWIGDPDPLFEGEEEEYVVNELLGTPEKFNMFKGVRAVGPTPALVGTNSTEISAGASRRRLLDDIDMDVNSDQLVQPGYISLGKPRQHN